MGRKGGGHTFALSDHKLGKMADPPSNSGQRSFDWPIVTRPRCELIVSGYETNASPSSAFSAHRACAGTG